MENPEFYDLMYTLLDTNELSESVMNLLNRLPASPMLVQRILNLQGVRGSENANWNQLLDTKNSFRLLSTLMLIEYLMEDDQTSASNKPSDVARDSAATLAGSEEQINEEKENNTDEIPAAEIEAKPSNEETKKSQQKENATS